jgi:hypothetical protein
MPTVVEVPAVKLMAYRGRTYVRGEVVAMRPIDALAASRRGEVSLTRGAMIAPDPEPEPAPEPVPVRRQRRYTRRDLSAE